MDTASIGRRERSDRLETIYAEMEQRNTRLIAENGILWRDYLDTEKCICIYSKFSEINLNDNYYSLMKKLASYGITYLPIGYQPISEDYGTLHFTLLQLIGFKHYNSDYDRFIEKYNITIPVMRIVYTDIILTQTCVVMVGEADMDVNSLRDNIKEKVLNDNLPLLEQYKSNTIHSTILRFNKPIDIDQLENIIFDYKNKMFGNVVCGSFNLGIGDWRLR